ncbi:MAG: hypothetical protein AAFX40_02120 [Cyanobacteria bacterium J06639_1]
MSSPMQAQAAKVWGIVSDSEFWDTYRKAIDAIWKVIVETANLLKEVGILAWLTICLVLVLGDWLWSGGVSVYAKGRDVVQNLTAEKEDGEQLGAGAGQALVTASRSSLASAIAGARSQLGLPEKTQAPLELAKPAEKEKVAVAAPAAKVEAPAKAAAPPVAEKAAEPKTEAEPEPSADTTEDEAEEA